MSRLLYASSRAGAGAGGPGLLATFVSTFIAGVLVLVLAGNAALVMAQGQYPAPRGLVNDFAGVLSDSEVRDVEDICRSLQERTGAELAVVTVPTTREETVESYAVNLFSAWGIGKKGEDNGVLLLLATEDRQTRVEVGYGLEGVLPDGKVGAIMDRYLLPALRQGRYGEGIKACVQALADEIVAAHEGQPSPLGETPVSTAPRALFLFGLLPFLVFLLVGAVVVAGVMKARGPRCPSCHSRLTVREKVLVPAAIGAAGLGLVIYTCRKCGYHHEKERMLPALVIPPPGAGKRDGPFGGGWFGGGWFGGGGGSGG
ncbi:MAG TPA: hypothetical protein GX513_12225, partial [Firmicutes bacterium]|nr:hypothetical protein [Bacillota bacterium]